MSDPSLRRLLDASRNSDIPPHWQIQKRHEVRDQEVLTAMAEVERRAQRYAALLGRGFDEQKRPADLEDSIHAALRQADSYDREVFESMGVKTIWVDQFEQIPEIIDAIASRRSWSPRQRVAWDGTSPRVQMGTLTRMVPCIRVWVSRELLLIF